MSADAHHLTASHPEGLGAKLVMRNALEDAEMDPKEVDYINVHGTSTPVGDISGTCVAPSAKSIESRTSLSSI